MCPALSRLLPIELRDLLEGAGSAEARLQNAMAPQMRLSAEWIAGGFGGCAPRVDRTFRDLERLLATLKHAQRDDKFSIARLHSLGLQLLTYVRSNRGAIVNYRKRYRVELRAATTLAESAVHSLVAKQMVKKLQMRWSLHGAHVLMQVRTAELNGELRDRLRTQFRQPEPNVPSLFKLKPPLLRAA